MIGILDYGVGNVGAFLRIYHSQNIDALAVKSSSDFSKINKIILPGVGSFDAAMSKLNNSGLRDGLDEFVLGRKLPLLGVCIGMHMLGSSSEEGVLAGLGYINGQTLRMATNRPNISYLLPHMGWNSVSVSSDDAIWKGVNLEQGFYFLHSYSFRTANEESVIGISNYYGEITCAIKAQKIYGFQFHPEKSLSNGITLLCNFAESI